MKAKRLSLACFMAIAAGCVPVVSLHPLFTEDTIVFEEKLLGTWADTDQSVTWEFTRLDDELAESLSGKLPADPNRFYHLEVTDRQGNKGVFLAGLVRLDGRLYLDVFADRFPSGEREAEAMKLVYNAFFFIPAHTFVSVDLTDEQLTVRLTNDDKFEELLETEPDAVAHQVVDDRPILTAPTDELQSFIIERAGDERLFPSETTLTRKQAR